MSNTRFYEKMDDLFLIIYLKKLGLDVKNVQLLSINPEKGYRQFFFNVKPEKSLTYKKAVGTFDNMNISFDILAGKKSQHFEYDRSWQTNMHRCCGDKYYNWHEDLLDKKIIALREKMEKIRVGNNTKNLNKAKQLKRDLKAEIQGLEDLRLIVSGKVRKTPNVM